MALELDGHAQAWLLGVFGFVIVAFLIVDLGYLNRKAHAISTRSALYQSIFWVFVSCVFGVLIYFFYPKDNAEATLQFFSGYLMEKALSVDNVFVILLIFRYFKIEDRHYHRVLFWGILGSILFRGIFILAGSLLVERFHWILYIFGFLLIYSGFKVYFENQRDTTDPEDNIVLRLCRKYLPLSDSHEDGKFFIRNPTFKFTPLFLVLVLVETVDLVFAIDSIPAVFAITQDDFLIYTSNIFAVLGLRAMFFLLMSVVDRFHLLQRGLSFILLFIGFKMVIEIFDITVPIEISFIVILATFTLSIVFSVLFPRKTT